MRRIALLALNLLVLAGCSSGATKSTPSLYLLRAAEAPAATERKQPAPAAIGIGRVLIADYLAGDGIVVMTGQNKLQVARQHLWAEPLDNAISLFLRDSISAELGFPVLLNSASRIDWDYRIDIEVDEWHGSFDGDVVLDASWTVLGVVADKAAASYRFRQTKELTEDGYDALVAAQIALLNDLASGIAESVEAIRKSEAD